MDKQQEQLATKKKKKKKQPPHTNALATTHNTHCGGKLSITIFIFFFFLKIKNYFRLAKLMYKHL